MSWLASISNMNVVGIRSVIIVNNYIMWLSILSIRNGIFIDALNMFRWYVEPPCTEKEYR